MDTSTAPRKRLGRPSKNATAELTASSSQGNESTRDACTESNFSEQCKGVGSDEKSSASLVNTMKPTGAATLDSVAVGECRRSSRKKIIKFDVLDVLKKNRKPHKIQIEARIDSNAPTPSKAVNLSNAPGINTSAATTSLSGTAGDLTDKQKIFMEKSAIFRRYSISEQQNKVIAPPRPPLLPQPTTTKITILSKSDSGEGNDVAPNVDPEKIAQARRLSRTQEIFNATMLKSKQNASLIVAQMESSSATTAPSTGFGNIATAINLPATSSKPITAVAGKSKLSASENKAARGIQETPTTQKRRGRPPKPKHLSTSVTQMHENTSIMSPEKAKNWSEYKACLKETVPKPSAEELKSKVQNTTIPIKAIDIVEISSSSCSTIDSELQTQNLVEEVNLTKHSFDEENTNTRNDNMQITVNVELEENKNIIEQRKNTEVQIVADEKQITESLHKKEIVKVDEIVNVEAKAPETLESLLLKTTPNILQTDVIATKTDNEQEDEKANRFEDNSKIDYELLLTPPHQTASSLGVNRTTSSSESDTSFGSDHKSHQKCHKLRVSVKRLSMPSSPNTSISSITLNRSQSSSSASSSGSESSIIGKLSDTEQLQQSTKLATSKRSKRLSKKCNLETVEKVITYKKNEMSEERNEQSPTLETQDMNKKNEDLKESATKHAVQGSCIEIFDNKEVKEVDLFSDENKDNKMEMDKNESKAHIDSDDLDIEELISKQTHINLPIKQYTSEYSNVHVQKDENKTAVKIETSAAAINAAQKLDNDVPNSENMAKGKVLQDAATLQEKENNTEIPKESVATSDATENVVPVAVVEKTSDGNKKEHRTLPPKKQLSKFKQYEIAVTESCSSASEPSGLPNDEIMQNVSVETSTLLNILKTVQSNEQAAAAQQLPTINPIEYNEAIIACDESSQSMSAQSSSSLAMGNVENFEKSTTPSSFEVISKSSPTRSDSGSPNTMKKTTRRYERRSRRGGDGDNGSHKTLEETFAEIAAQSSKEILEWAARESNQIDEVIEETSVVPFANVSDDNSNQHGKSTEAVVLEKVDTKTDPEIHADASESTIQVLEKDCEIRESLHEAVMPSDVIEKVTYTDIDTVQKEALEEISKCTESITENSKSEAKEELSPTVTTTRRGRKPKNKPSEMTVAAEEQPTANDILKDFEPAVSSEQNVEDTSEISDTKTSNEDSTTLWDTQKNVDLQAEVSEDNIRAKTSIAEEKVLTDKFINIETVSEILAQTTSTKILETIPTKDINKAKDDVKSPANVLANEKDDRTPPMPPLKKRLSKMQSEFGDNWDMFLGMEKVKSVESVSEMNTPKQDKKKTLTQSADKECDREGSAQRRAKNKYPKSTDDEKSGEDEGGKGSDREGFSKKESKKSANKSTNVVGDSNEIFTKNFENEDSNLTTPATLVRTPTPKRSKNKQKSEDSSSLEQATSSGKKKPKKTADDSVTKSTSEKGSEKKTPEEKYSNKKTSDKKEKEKSVKKCDKKKSKDKQESTASPEQITKTFEEKSDKKQRQKKLREAFQAALSEDAQKSKRDSSNSALIFERLPGTPDCLSPIRVLTPLTPTEFDKKIEDTILEHCHKASTVEGPGEPEEVPDPLRDIEKFIEDGVNLLKRDYKMDDSVDEVISTTLHGTENSKDSTEDKKCDLSLETNITDTTNDVITTTTITPIKSVDNGENSTIDMSGKFTMNIYETPADTPLTTPTVTPPPKSPVMDNTSLSEEVSGVRRSHRIKQITKTPKALVGRGLVRDKERFSMKDDVETKSYYSLDDHLMDLAEVEAKNAKFLKDMEERLSNFQVIKDNEYKCERVISREARKMICDCFLTTEEEGRGELGCGEDCLNRLLMIECGPDCNVKERCTNKRFQKLLCSPCRVFRTEKKGFGIMADIEILPGEFIMEYVGEVIDGDEFEQRRTLYSLDKNRHYYFMALRSDAIIDATIKGNISRFINHSCDPNAETQKWTVNGELRIGFFSRKSIMPGEEITFDYQYQRYGREAQRCYCESSNCRGWIGEEPNSDEGEQLDDESDEENLDESLLDDDEDEDSDASVSDTEAAQKKLEIAAAEAKLAPISDDMKTKVDAIKDKKKKASAEDGDKKESEEDSKSKFKKLLNRMAEKAAKKKKQKESEKKQRKQNRRRSPNDKSRYLEDPDIEDEVNFLSRCGLKNQLDTLRLSRLMVRAKLVQTRLNLLEILRKGELPCRRLFLDYHGLRFLHGWMSEDGGNMEIRMALLETLECLPIANKTVLTDSKVLQSVRNWCGASNSTGDSLSPSDESSKESSSSSSQQAGAASSAANVVEVPTDVQKLAAKLSAAWDSLPEIFRIPKRERIEQMKEHEREADRQYAAAVEDDKNKSVTSDRYQRDRFGRGLANRFAKPSGKEMRNICVVGSGAGPSSSDQRRRGAIDNAGQLTGMSENTKHLSKEQRRELFAAKVARDEAEKRLAEERREFETKCRFFGLDPKKTHLKDMPFCVNPATGQWFSAERQPVPTPPSYAHVQVPVKPKSTNPADYQLPSAVATLPRHWKFAITTQGKIYYYHIQHRVPQWEPPSPVQCKEDMEDSESESELTPDDSGDDEDDILLGMDQTQLKAYIEKKIEMRRQKRYTRLVDERPISPRREEDRLYNQLEVRKYKENKEKIRKRKEEIRRKRIEALKNTQLNMCTLGSLEESSSNAAADAQTDKPNDDDVAADNDELVGALPIQDYLISSDEEEIIKAECNNSPLIDKIVQGDKIVDELDALTTKRPLKRALPPHRDLSTHASTSAEASNSGSTSGNSAGNNTTSSSQSAKHEYKRRKLEKKEKLKKSKESDSKYRKVKEKFRCEIAGIIVHHLKSYRKDSCMIGRIQSDEDFNHLAKKLTHFVMIKELKYCESVGQTIVVTESVKNKSREFIKKYMAKYGDVYVKPKNDPEFKDIPFTL